MRHAERFGDLADIALDTSFVLHDRGAANDFQVRHLRQIGENFILHAIGKKGILLFVPQIFKRQDGDAFFGNVDCGWLLRAPFDGEGMPEPVSGNSRGGDQRTHGC